MPPADRSKPQETHVAARHALSRSPGSRLFVTESPYLVIASAGVDAPALWLAARCMRAIDVCEGHVSISTMEGLSDEGESAAANCRVVLAPGGGWDVIVERDQLVVSVRHCTNWQRVEQVCNVLMGATSACPAPVGRST
jgi:hypothetical protein